ncbi:hypothetical protein PPYR_05245 [Photinus pyralis]|uniref:Uncharacterized protein n=1 Tax=Photinus pyralis TaxID=7054 RepID=A0A5N4AU73_PHOPY|nr:hypothetical protein PPYR_05245 [Photinus pyralis]
MVKTDKVRTIAFVFLLENALKSAEPKYVSDMTILSLPFSSGAHGFLQISKRVGNKNIFFKPLNIPTNLISRFRILACTMFVRQNCKIVSFKLKISYRLPRN